MGYKQILTSNTAGLSVLAHPHPIFWGELISRTKKNSTIPWKVVCIHSVDEKEGIVVV